ncbi:MAG: hypothetical protein CL840_18525 [Crocinitomicaceae bacterium]|nr:hypothetical protein [Crocinitomicaceae bacterium]|tara:strand:- start:17207 stop:17824 length:618 start_codon:yes stop_codon:yes gene_type:complete
MLRALVSIVLTSVLFTEVMAQDKESYSYFEKEVFFSEKFQDNQNSWRIFYKKIKKERYIVETIGKDLPLVSTIPIKIDQGENYEIEVVVSNDWNKSKDYMGLVWNRDANNGYYIGFNKEMSTKLFFIEEGNRVVIEEKSRPEILYPMYEKNIITVRKVGREFTLFINKVLIKTIPMDMGYRDHVGFFVGSSSELRAYSLTISYLD